MIKHHRVQMRPVAVRARFWVTESFSTGRAKSEMPAMTRAHYSILAPFHHPHTSVILWVGQTFMTGALGKLARRAPGAGSRKERAGQGGDRTTNSPEVHRLHANGAIPHALEPGLLRIFRGSTLPPPLPVAKAAPSIPLEGLRRRTRPPSRRQGLAEEGA